MKMAKSAGLGAELRRLREAAGITELDLLPRLGVDSSHLSRLERGHREIQPGFASRYIDAVLDIHGARHSAVWAIVSVLAKRGLTETFDKTTALAV